ncbi:condensation domain-containing protein [Streptomyces sp. NPDC005962]|uniref:condensation domain-containing protein n=1 Tax=Streptomyces sp. NPDC005962 TaxID=3154466 RepID=UPI0033DCBC1A
MTELSKDDIRNAAAEVLAVAPETITDSANLITVGMDSIRMMRLAGGWRRTGSAVTFRQLAEDPTVERWHALLTAHRATPQDITSQDTTSRNTTPQDTAPPAVDTERPPVDAAAPFGLTPVQRAYWIGRSEGMALGGVGCHAYLELDGTAIRPDRLETAVRRVLARHGMLRARFLDDGRQQILPLSPWPGLRVHDVTASGTDKAEQHLEELRASLSHRVLDVAAGEVFDVQLSLLPDEATRIHVNIDLLVADVASIELVLADLATAYADPERLGAEPGYGFPQYLDDYRAWCGAPGAADSPLAVAREFWRGKLSELPLSGPALPLAVRPEDVTRPVFSRRGFLLDAADWERVTRRAREHRLTSAMVLATAYAEVLGAWSTERDFLLNVPLFDRQPLDPAVNGMVADFTNLVLLRVDVRRPLPFAERVRDLQRQLQENASHAQYSTLSVLQDLRRANGGKRAAAPVVFACNLGSAFVRPEVRAELGEWNWMLSQTPQVWLDHQVYKIGGSVLLAWDAVDELFPAGLLDDMLRSYQRLLTALADEDNDWSEPAAVSTAGVPAQH